MFKKGALKRAIQDSQREIEALELKRERSQMAIMRAMISGQQPSPIDLQYFNTFSTLIDNEREHLRSLVAELESLQGKKK